MKNSKKNEVEVVEANRAVAVRTANAEVIAEAIKKQVVAIGEIELRGNFEKLKLGAMVSEAVRIMELDGEPGRGPTAAGGGALGWWNEVCQKNERGETVIAYKTVMRWKEAAERLPTLLCIENGGGSVDQGKVMALLAKNPEKAVGKNKAILASAEKVANGMTMRQMLLWGGDAEPSKGKVGRPKGTKADLSRKPDTTDTVAAARAVWSQVIVPADRCATALAAAVKLLSAKDVDNAKIVLQNLMDLLKEREAELKR